MAKLRASAMTAGAAHAVDVRGYSVYESGGSDAVVLEFRNGVVGGDVLHTVGLAAGGAESVMFSYDLEVTHAAGLWVKAVGSGTIVGTFLSEVG